MNKERDTTEQQQITDPDIIYRYNREVFYHFDREHGFRVESDYQNPSNQVIIKQSWDAAQERLEKVKQQVIAGNASPVAYYMEKILMEVPMLAAYMDIPKWRVRRHLRQRVFQKLKPALLERYAGVFGVTVEALKNPF